MVLRDRTRYRQPQPDTLVLGAGERPEQAVDKLARHTRPVVGNLNSSRSPFSDTDRCTRFSSWCATASRALRSKLMRIWRICTGSACNGGKPGSMLDDSCVCVSPFPSFRHFQARCYEFSDIKRLSFRGLLFNQLAHSLDDFACPFSFPFSLFNHGKNLWIYRTVVPGLPGDRLQIEQNRCQGLIEFMRDRGAHLVEGAEAGHMQQLRLRFCKAFLDDLPRSQIPENADELTPVRRVRLSTDSSIGKTVPSLCWAFTSRPMPMIFLSPVSM